MTSYLPPTRGPVPPIIVNEPGAESDERSPQEHGRSRDMDRLGNTSARPRSRSPFRRLRRQSNGTPTIASVVSPIVATIKDPANVATLYEVKVVHDWASDLVKVTKDVVKKIGHTESSPDLGVYDIMFGPGEVRFPARVELSHSRKNSVLKVMNLRTKKEVVGVALLPRSLAKHLRSSARLGLAPNTLPTTIYVDDNELKLCELVLTTCAFPDCPSFHPERTYRWYWVIVDDERKVLGENAFIPYAIVQREEIPPLPTASGWVPLLTH